MNMFLGMDEQDILRGMLENLVERTYDGLFLINVKSNKARKYCLNKNRETTVFSDIIELEDADAGLSQYFEEDYVGDDICSFLSEVKVSTMEKRLSERNSVEFCYSVCENGMIRRKRIEYRYFQPYWRMICLTRQDITDRYEKEQRNASILDYSLQVAQDAVLMKYNFLQKLSQEIRTPLYNFSVMLEQIISRENEGKENIEQLLSAKKDMDQINYMLAQFLDMAVIEQENLRLEQKPFLLQAFLDEIKESLRPLALQKNQQVIFEVDDPKPCVLMGDPVYLRQVFLGIMDNSLRYGKEGGYAKCHIVSQRNGTNKLLLIITFTDNGRGMSEKMADKIFAGEWGIKEQHTSRELGLLMIKNIVNKSGGTIRLESEAGVGTKVTVKLPTMEVSGVEQEFKEQFEHLVRAEDELDFTKFRALIVNGDEIAGKVIELRLRKLGLQVETMNDGKAALDCLLHSKENEYHIVFSDMYLPGLNGMDMTRKLRDSSRQDLSDMPIVALTAHASLDDRLDALESGMDYHLPLPVKDIEIKDILVRELFNLSLQKESEVRNFRVVK